MGLACGSVTRAAATSLVATLLACGSAGNSVETFDNSGGAPPPGTSVSFEVVPFSVDAPGGPPLCNSSLTRNELSLLVRKASDIPVVNGDEGCTAGLRAALGDAFSTLTADQAIGIFALSLGGCADRFELTQVYRDQLVLRPWIVILDTALGGKNVACNSAAVAYLQALRISSTAGATSMELYRSRVNPNYPRRPDVPVW